MPRETDYQPQQIVYDAYGNPHLAIGGPGVPADSYLVRLKDGSYGYQDQNGNVYSLDGTLLFKGTGLGPGGSPSGGGSGGGGGGGSSGTSYVLTTADGEKLTQAQYDALSAAYTHYARQYGVSLSDSQIRYNIQQGVSADEFRQRLEAEHILAHNGTALDQFEAELRKEGLINQGQKFGRDERLKFILRQAPSKWNDVWQMAYLRTLTKEAGGGIGNVGDLQLSRGQLQNIRGIEEGQGLISGTQFSPQVAANIQNVLATAIKVLPAARFRGYQENQDDLIAGIIGGDATKMAAAQRILDSEALKYKGPGPQQIVSTPGGGYAPLGLQGIGAPGGR